MQLVHYQTLEAVNPEELRALQAIKERFNEQRDFWGKIKLWRKADILEGLEPSGARWGFTRVSSDAERQQVLSTIRRMSEATPRLTWLIYDEANGGKEIVFAWWRESELDGRRGKLPDMRSCAEAQNWS